MKYHDHEPKNFKGDGEDWIVVEKSISRYLALHCLFVLGVPMNFGVLSGSLRQFDPLSPQFVLAMKVFSESR